MTGPVGRFFGVSSLVAVFVAMQWLVLELRGYTVEAFSGVGIGALAGLISLVVEIAMLERASRTFYAQGVQVTFMSFVMRLVVVAPLTLWFLREGSPTDHEAFALSYCSTFFVYLCWLTWTSYHAPVCYRGRKAGAAPRVVQNRPRVGSVRP